MEDVEAVQLNLLRKIQLNCRNSHSFTIKNFETDISRQKVTIRKIRQINEKLNAKLQP